MLNNTSLKIKIVQNDNERLKAMTIRTLVYIAEQNCPYDEEFDLNDHTATQILGTIGSEPILTARIRYFGNFAKLERLAVRKEYRGMGFGQKLLDFMISFCVTKGFNQIYLHAQKGKEGFYLKNNFKIKNNSFHFSGYDYTEMFRDLSKTNSLLCHNPHAMQLNRPEGAWDQAGPLETTVNQLQQQRRKQCLTLSSY